jgi:hypothetical protein
VFNKAALEISFEHFRTEREEVERIGVLDNLLCKLGLFRRQGARKVRERAPLAPEKIAVDLVREDVAAPTLRNRLMSIPCALFALLDSV